MHGCRKWLTYDDIFSVGLLGIFVLNNRSERTVRVIRRIVEPWVGFGVINR